VSWFNNDTGYKTRVPTCSLKMLQALRAESQYSMILTCTDFASFAETQRDLNLSQQCGPARRVKEMTRIQVDYECGRADQSCTSAVDEKRLIRIQWVEFHKALSIPVWCTSPPGAKVFRQKTGRIPSNQGSCDQGLKRGTLHFGYF